MSHLQELKIAQNEYTEALIRLATAKFKTKDKETALLIEGIEGKNQAARDALLWDALEVEHLEEHRANIKVIEKRGAFENASRQYEFDIVQSQL